MVGSNSRAVREATNFDKNVASKSFRNHKGLIMSGREQRARGSGAVLRSASSRMTPGADEAARVIAADIGASGWIDDGSGYASRTMGAARTSPAADPDAVSGSDSTRGSAPTSAPNQGANLRDGKPT